MVSETRTGTETKGEMASHPLWTARKRLLSLDGGGVRGVVALAFLDVIETKLKGSSGRGDAFRLSDHFDLVGGTSTGAIIASALATGRSVADIRELYFGIATEIFRKSWKRIPFFQALYGSRRVRSILIDELGDIHLDDPSIRTHLAIVTKRIDTGSPWIISNLPGQPFWDDPPDGSYLGNRHYNLVNVVRASTAAPYFFAPETIAVAEGVKARFVDGGVSPHNSPVLPVLMLATMRRYGLAWPFGPENLSMVSIGTGQYKKTLKEGRTPAIKFAIDAVQGLMDDCQDTALLLMQWLSDQQLPWQLNSDVLNLAGDYLGGGPALSFQRFNIRLESDWLKEHCGLDVGQTELAKMRRLDATSGMQDLFELASTAARRQVEQCCSA